MIRAFHTSATGMAAQQLVVDNTANNLANVNTAGFKRSQIAFQDLIYLTVQQPGTQLLAGQQVPTGLQIGNGVRVAGNSKIFTTGPLENTGNSLDIAIAGEGFFRIQAPDGTFLYTRDGSFQMNQNGELVTADGYRLDPAITIPNDATSISIGIDGTVSVLQPGSTQPTQVGQITLSRFPNPAGLSAEGANMFRATDASGPETQGQAGQQGFGLIRQGFLERSNVEVVRELVNLIQAQRAYEFNTRAIRVADEMLSDTNQVIR